MPEFVVFAIAASMCVLCFAVGFIAALGLRIAEHTALPSLGAPGRPATPTPAQADADADAVRPDTTDTRSAPAAPGRAITVAHAESTVESRPDVAARSTTPMRRQHATHADSAVGFPTPPAPAAPAAPAAKLYLFGDPHQEAAAVPSLAGVHSAAQSNAWGAQHGAPPRLAPAEIDLLPHRPQYARSGRRR
jgi:hypothetical protein